MINIIVASDYRLKRFVKVTIQQCKRLNYNCIVYDLGGLGIGSPFKVDSPIFQKVGYYHVMNKRTGWCSRALHKPELIQRAIEEVGSGVYLDADAIPVGKLDELSPKKGEHFVVTQRPETERNSPKGAVNAGVIGFCESALEHVKHWAKLTKETKNDQVAFNRLINLKDVHAKAVPCELYNYYFFPRAPSSQVRILHFKSDHQCRTEFEKYCSLLNDGSFFQSEKNS